MRPGFWTAMALTAPLLGCTGSVTSPAGPGDAEATTTSAIIIVQRSVDATAGTRAETSARFVRVPASTPTRDAIRAIGAAVDLPALASCASIASLANGDGSAPSVPVIELADVGTVSVEASGHETRLLPRQLPDVTDVVSGVVYARSAEPTVFAAGVRYVVHVAGGADIDPFDVTATAPADPSDVHVVGEDAPTGLTVASGQPIELTWSSDGPEDGPDDVLYLDVQPSAYRCALPEGSTPSDDRAHATVPAALIDDAGTLVLHRVHREALGARGLESGEIRFDFSRSVPYVRR